MPLYPTIVLVAWISNKEEDRPKESSSRNDFISTFLKLLKTLIMKIVRSQLINHTTSSMVRRELALNQKHKDLHPDIRISCLS